MLAVVSSQATWVLILMPLLGLALSVLLLYGFGLSSETLGFAATGDERPAPTLGARMENLSASRRSRGSDGDLVAFASEEDAFQGGWRRSACKCSIAKEANTAPLSHEECLPTQKTTNDIKHWWYPRGR